MPMDFNYNYPDVQSLLGSLDSTDDEFQLTANNLYQNEGFWSNNDNGDFELNKVQIKNEYISPDSLNTQSNTSPNDDQLLNEIINFEDSNNVKFKDDDIDSQLDELIQSSTQVPTPISSSASVTESPSDSQKSSYGFSNTPVMSKATIGNGGKVSKPKKSRSSHNLIEKKYRTNINSKIMELRDAVPALRIASDANQETTIDDLEGLTPAAKLNKASILTKATEYIKHLENKNDMLSNDVFQLRNILSQFQQMLPQVPQHQQQSGSSQSVPQQSQQQQYQNSPTHSSPLQSQQQQQSPQQRPPFHSHSQQSYTDQVNMGLNGFVPTVNQVQAAQLQLQNMQQTQSAPGSHQHHSPSDGSLSFGNKVLVGGMTALLGSQMFVGGADGNNGFDYKGLSFIPIHKLFPIINSDVGQFVLQFMRLSMVLAGAFSILEPILFLILSKFNQDEKDKLPVYLQDSSWTILQSYLNTVAIKLGFRDSIDDLGKIDEFNKTAAKKISECLAEEVKSYNGWKKVLTAFGSIEEFSISDSVNEKDKVKRNEIASTLIEFSFTKLIFASLLSVKLGSVISGLIGLNKTVDTTMLKIIKLMRFIDVDSLKNENALQIYKLVNSDTEFVDSVCLYGGLCDLFGLGKENILKSLFVSEPFKAPLVSNPVLNNVSDLINSSADLSIVNLVITIRCQEVLDRNLVKYTQLTIREDKSDGSSLSSSNSEDDETDTEVESKEEIVGAIYKELVKYEKLIPENSFKLVKAFKFCKILAKPNLDDLKDIVEIVKSEACELIDYSDVSLEESKEVESNVLDAKVNKIIKFATLKAQFSKQHSNNVSPSSSSLISQENHLLLTCSFILYYHSINNHEGCIQLNRFLKINHDLSLLSFIALYEASNILIDELLKREEVISKSIAEVTTKVTGESEEEEDSDDDGSSSSTINLNSTKILESKSRVVEYYKSNIEQLILKSRLLIAQTGTTSNSINQLHRLSLSLKSEVSDKLVKMGKKINGYD